MLKIIKGDVTNPILREGESCLIPHVCNNRGRMGSGVAKALYEKWEKVKTKYVEWHYYGSFHHSGDYNVLHLKNDNSVITPFQLGQIQVIPCEPSIAVVNMLGQATPGGDDIKVGDKVVHLRPVRYDCIREAMYRVAGLAIEKGRTIHCPWFSAGLAGGTVEQTKTLIQEIWVDNGIEVTIYE